MENTWRVVGFFVVFVAGLVAGVALSVGLASPVPWTRPQPAPTRAPERPGRPARPIGELRELGLVACWQPAGQADERIALPPGGEPRQQFPGRGGQGGLYVLPESILSDFADLVRHVGRFVGLVEATKERIEIGLDDRLFDYAWWAVFAAGAVAATMLWLFVAAVVAATAAIVGKRGTG